MTNHTSRIPNPRTRLILQVSGLREKALRVLAAQKEGALANTHVAIGLLAAAAHAEGPLATGKAATALTERAEACVSITLLRAWQNRRAVFGPQTPSSLSFKSRC